VSGAAVLPRGQVDLLDLVGRDTWLRKIAGTRGGEYAGPCPDCGGKDRFRVQPERGLWWCRACRDRWGDAIDYVRWRTGCSFPDACRELGVILDGPRAGAIVRRLPAPALAEDAEAPTADWRERAERYVAEAEAALWAEDGARARSWLMARGLSERTIRRWRLGYQLADAWQAPEAWGLDGGKRIWLPRGVVIPWRLDDELWQVKIRRAEGEPKYVAARGGHPVLFAAETLGGHDVAALTEGEFDAMLLEQECGDLVGVATLGSASRGIDPRAADALLGARVIFALHDRDAEGERGAARLGALTGRAHRLSVPGAKDGTDYWKAGGDLRAWLTFELERLDLLSATTSAPSASVAVARAPSATRPPMVCWGRERGDIAVRDPWGEWHEIAYRDATPIWQAAVRSKR